MVWIALGRIDVGPDRIGAGSVRSGTSVTKKKPNIFYVFLFRYWKGFVVDPSQSYYYRWLFVISIAVLYNIIFIIARATFIEMQQEYQALWFTLDYCSDFLYILDMIVSLKTGIYYICRNLPFLKGVSRCLQF